jgi:hypothetical protein
LALSLKGKQLLNNLVAGFGQEQIGCLDDWQVNDFVTISFHERIQIPDDLAHALVIVSKLWMMQWHTKTPSYPDAARDNNALCSQWNRGNSTTSEIRGKYEAAGQ